MRAALPLVAAWGSWRRRGQAPRVPVAAAAGTAQHPRHGLGASASGEGGGDGLV